MIILKTELRKNSAKNMRKMKFLQQCTLFHATVKHINVLKSMMFQITLTLFCICQAIQIFKRSEVNKCGILSNLKKT